MARLEVNMETLERLRNGQPWDELAYQIGIDRGTLSRIRHGHSQPGPRFIAQMITKFPVRFEDIVTVTDGETFNRKDAA